MVMTEEKIASAAARRSAARRKRVTGRCEVCGTEFEGLATRRYCSDRCRVQAARNREEDASVTDQRDVPTTSFLAELGLQPHPGEGAADHLARVRRAMFGDRILHGDSTEIVRASRIERTNELMRAMGWDELVEAL